MLKHIKDIRSPIVVAQQKHAARKANSIISTDTSATAATSGHSKPSTTRTLNRPPKLEVPDLGAPTSLPSGLSPQPGWPELGIASPSVDPRAEESAGLGSAGSIGKSHLSTSTTMTGATVVGSTHDLAKPRGAPAESGEQPLSSGREMPVASTSGVSYAVAIYPYMAEQEDEFDVVVLVFFIIFFPSRA